MTEYDMQISQGMVSSVFAHQLTVPAIFYSSHIAPPPPSPPPTYFIGKVLRDETTEKTSSFHKHDQHLSHFISFN